MTFQDEFREFFRALENRRVTEFRSFLDERNLSYSDPEGFLEFLFKFNRRYRATKDAYALADRGLLTIKDKYVVSNSLLGAIVRVLVSTRQSNDTTSVNDMLEELAQASVSVRRDFFSAMLRHNMLGNNLTRFMSNFSVTTEDASQRVIKPLIDSSDLSFPIDVQEVATYRGFNFPRNQGGLKANDELKLDEKQESLVLLPISNPRSKGKKKKVTTSEVKECGNEQK